VGSLALILEDRYLLVMFGNTKKENRNSRLT